MKKSLLTILLAIVGLLCFSQCKIMHVFEYKYEYYGGFVRVRIGAYNNSSNLYNNQIRVMELPSGIWKVSAFNGAAVINRMDTLLLGKKYVWQIRSSCGPGDTTAWSDSVFFSTTCMWPEYQTQQVYVDSVRLTWQHSAPQAQVRLEREDTSYFVVSDTTVLLDTLREGQYFWRVRNICGPGDTSEWSDDTVGFYFNLPSCFPVTSHNVYSITDSSAILTWSSTTSAYQVRYSEKSPVNWKYAIVTTGLFKVNDLVGGKKYIWEVRRICSPGDTSSWRAGPEFETPVRPLCEIPHDLSVSNLLMNSARLNWLGNSAQYQVIVRDNLGVVSDSYTSNSFKELSGLSNYTDYKFVIRSICGPGDTSAWSDEETFQTLLFDPCPTPDTLWVDSVSTTAARLHWNGNAAKYVVRFTADGNSYSYYALTTSNSLLVDTLFPGRKYKWQVRAICSDGDTSNWSVVKDFRTDLTGSCLAPDSLYEGSISPTTAQLGWRDAGPKYQIRTRMLPSGNWTYAYITDNHFNLNGLSPKTEYEWEVRTLCTPGDTSNWSGVNQFKTPPSCYTPTNITSTVLSGFEVRLNWNATAPKFEVELIDEGMVDQDTIVFTNKVNLRLAKSNHTYQWRIRAICSAGDTSDWSDTAFFKTKKVCLSPDSVWVNNMGDDGATVHWIGNGAKYSVEVTDSTYGYYNTSYQTTNDSVRVTGLVAGRTYIFAVFTICSPGDTAEQATIVYATMPLLDTCPAVDTIHINWVGNVTAHLNWMDVGPLYRIALTGDKGTSKLDYSTLPKWSYLNELIPGEIYTVEVTTICAAGDTAAPSSLNFKKEHTGISTYSEQENLTVYPNPGSGVFNVSSGSILESVEVMDLSGKLVYSGQPKDRKFCFTLSAESGIYLMRITTNSGVYVRNLLKN